MDRAQLKDEIVFKVTGGLLTCELGDKQLDMVINGSLREIQRYIDITKLVTVPYKRCIDMSEYKINSVSRVYRAIGLVSNGEDIQSGTAIDPMYASQWQLLSGTGNLANYTEYAYNYGAWNTLLQIRNTTSTDFAFHYDHTDKKLYINVAASAPNTVTIEYVPRFDDVTEIHSDFWIDMLTKMCVAYAKIALGRIRTRYTQSGALWTQDGETMLSEGNAELQLIQENLKKATQLVYPVD